MHSLKQQATGSIFSSFNCRVLNHKIFLDVFFEILTQNVEPDNISDNPNFFQRISTYLYFPEKLGCLYELYYVLL